jgi:hypothetical protein
MNWFPKEAIPDAPVLPLTGPPCQRCNHWNPQPTYFHTPRGFVVDHIQLCHAEMMHFDFGCFDAKTLASSIKDS